MKAAIVRKPRQVPEYGDFPEPTASPGEHLITVTAAALSQLTKGRAAGTHYSSAGQYPFVAGVDGVGRLEDGRRVYFALPTPPCGSMAERTVAAATHYVPVPDALDDITAAAIANPGMSSWAAFKERAKLKAGETVMINGATGTSGRLAVQIARHFGAKKIIATGRNPASLAKLTELGADATILLGADRPVLEDSFKQPFAQGVDVVLDYLWGESAQSLLVAAAKANPDGRPLRFVQIGAMSGQDISLPAAVLRASAINLMGSGFGSVSFARLINAIGELLQVAVPEGFRIETRTVPLSDLEKAWTESDSRQRIVFTP